eukprot:398217_1
MKSKHDPLLPEQSTINIQNYEAIEENNSRKCNRGIPRRYCLCFLSFLGLFNVYTLRVNLSVAIEPMSCQFHWNSFIEGVVLSAFFAGYLFGNIPGGWLANKYGGKLVFGIGVLTTALLTMILPLCASGSLTMDTTLSCYCSNDNSWCFNNGHYTNNNNTCAMIKHKYNDCNSNSYVIIAIIVRVLMGLFEGVTFPALMKLFNNWTPPNERSRMIGISYAGMSLGTTIGFPISSFIVSWNNNIYGGWYNVFYCFGIIGILWWILWCLFVYDNPLIDPFICDDELKYLKEQLPSSLIAEFTRNKNNLSQHENINKPEKIEWKYFLTEPCALALYTAHFSFDWSFYTLLTELPSYLNDQLNFDFARSGFVSVVPYFGQFIVSIIGSMIVDKIIINEIMTRTNARKSAQTIATIIPGILLVICGYLSNVTTVVILLSIAAALMGFGNSGFNTISTDISPTMSNTIYSISNTMGTIPGFICPILTGLILTGDNKNEEWQLIFYITFFVFCIGTTVFWIFGTAEFVPTLNTKQQRDFNSENNNDLLPK